MPAPDGRGRMNHFQYGKITWYPDVGAQVIQGPIPSGWESLGGALASGPDVSSWAAGRIDIFARGIDNTLLRKWFDGVWHDWESLGGQITSDPGAVSWAAGRIDIFARDQNNAMIRKWFDGMWRP